MSNIVTSGGAEFYSLSILQSFMVVLIPDQLWDITL